MTVKECYAAFGGDFEGTLARLSSEKLVDRFIRKFLADESFATLKKALEEENYEEAFRADRRDARREKAREHGLDCEAGSRIRAYQGCDQRICRGLIRRRRGRKGLLDTECRDRGDITVPGMN